MCGRVFNKRNPCIILSMNEKNVQSTEELISHINQAVFCKTLAYVWKRNFEGQTVINEKALILKVNDQNELKIELYEDSKLPVGEDVLFALDGGILVFKSKVLSSNGRFAVLSIPSMAKGIERRRSPRIPYKYDDRIDFEMEVKSDVTTAFLLDLSEHGMCLSFSDETVQHLRLEQIIKIVRPNKGVTYSSCIVRSIRVFKGAKIGRSKMYAVGLEFV